MTLSLYCGEYWIVRLFSDDTNIIQGCHRIWWKVSVYYFNLSVYGINMGIATGLGHQWKFGAVTIIALWGASLPSMYWYAIRGGGGLEMAWSFIYYPNIVMNMYLVWDFYATDWHAIQHEIRKREGMDDNDGDERRNERDNGYESSSILEQRLLSNGSNMAEPEIYAEEEMIPTGTTRRDPNGTHSARETLYGSIPPPL